ncbi:hypothetical protein HPP92_010779 [Vanilla planifolia]|uniref:Uncharacterized protein n=1 Tax=Vanilla planifolia TaxID=51239 RepID=A0A835V1R9_VANPL|nr:hypothetical protein HPP92_010779 [Vanilla planifolia]
MSGLTRRGNAGTYKEPKETKSCEEGDGEGERSLPALLFASLLCPTRCAELATSWQPAGNSRDTERDC